MKYKLAILIPLASMLLVIFLSGQGADADTRVLAASDWKEITQQLSDSGFGVAQEAYLKADNSDSNDQFAYSVAISGDTVVVGAPKEESDSDIVNEGKDDNSAESGAVYVFVYDGTNWSQQAYLKADNSDPGDLFGRSVAISGDTIVVGAPNENSDSNLIDQGKEDNSIQNGGAAYVFVREGTTWSQQAYLKADNSDTGDYFGESVAISDDIVVVGAWSESSESSTINEGKGNNDAKQAGAAYVFVRDGVNWSQEAYLKAHNSESTDLFGQAVAISGDTVVVGAYYESSDSDVINQGGDDNTALWSGAAYVFVRSGTNWSQQAYLKADNSNSWDIFGNAVAISGDTIVVGAPWEGSDSNIVNQGKDDNTASAGAAYVFVRTDNSWSQEAYLKAGNSDDDDWFGRSVAISGNRIVVGALGEGSDSNEINEGQGDNNTLGAGAAYVYVRNGTTWTQQSYLKAYNSDAYDWFGRDVAISGSKVVVGAYAEASDSNAINDGKDDNSGYNVGAAYMFELESPLINATPSPEPNATPSPEPSVTPNPDSDLIGTFLPMITR